MLLVKIQSCKNILQSKDLKHLILETGTQEYRVSMHPFTHPHCAVFETGFILFCQVVMLTVVVFKSRDSSGRYTLGLG